MATSLSVDAKVWGGGWTASAAAGFSMD